MASSVEFFAFENLLDSLCRHVKVPSERAMLIPLFAAFLSRDHQTRIWILQQARPALYP
jgi:hypothetical protein